MALKAKDRPAAGFKGEDGEARSLKRSGNKVSQQPRNSKGHDLKVNGKNVEVKSVTETSYPGSDGYPIRGFVFSNMKKNPKAEKYILRCLSKDRKKVVKKYEIPASKVKQRTLTLTRNSKYEGFKKDAFLSQSRPHGFEQPKKRSLKGFLRQKGYEAAGAVIGSMIGGGKAPVIQMGRAMLGYSVDMKDVKFKNYLGMAVGATAGKNIGKAIEYSTRKTYDEQKRIDQRAASQPRRGLLQN